MAGVFLLWSVPRPASDSPSIPYHTPVLAAAVREWASGSTRAIDAAQTRLGTEGVEYLAASFAAPAALAAIAAFHPDRILLDLGVSSHQIDTPERGFTFRPGAPLDMRMTGTGSLESGARVTARDILNTWPVERLTTVFTDYADERRGRALAREIVRRRLSAPFAISDDFVNAIRAVLGPRSGPPDFARLFQSLRIAVNEELELLAAALPALRDALVPRGRMGVITYHSGEDRIVKHAFREWGRECICPPRQPICTCRGRALGRVLTKKPVSPSPDEIASNPRARSAQFRAFETAAADAV